MDQLPDPPEPFDHVRHRQPPEPRIGTPHGPTWAQVVATTTGLRLSSPAGAASCTPGQARTAWRQGTPESSACTLAFTKASVRYPAGYPVTATTRWTADWTGSGATSGTLDPLTRTWVGNVPVAEVQTIVTG
jgi:hypothetical protein